MITEDQIETFKLYMQQRTAPVKRDVIAEQLKSFEAFSKSKLAIVILKIRQCREALTQRGIFVVSDFKNGMFVAKKSTDLNIEIAYEIKSAVSILRKAKLLKREQNRLRLLEGIETPENQLTLQEEELIQESEQLILELK